MRQARRAAGFSKTPAWAAKVGRSDRVLLGLERGEAVGPDTYAAVAEAIGWPLSRVYDILNGAPVRAGDHLRPVPSPLADVSDEELAAEVLRRMKGEAGGDTAPTNMVMMSAEEHDRLRRIEHQAMQDLVGDPFAIQTEAAQKPPRTD